MKKILFSRRDFTVYSGFMVNISAGFFILIFGSESAIQLTLRVTATIISLYLAIILERRFK